MTRNESSKNRFAESCFFITPIGVDGSETRRFADAIIEAVLAEVLNEHGLTVVASHTLSETGDINRQILECIEQSALVIADLTYRNPNVFYELGIRHSFAKPCVMIAAHGTQLPFDVNTIRTLFYTRDAYGIAELRSELPALVRDSLAPNKKLSGPVFDHIQASASFTELSRLNPGDPTSSALLLLQEQLNRIESRLDRPKSKPSRAADILRNRADGIVLTVLVRPRVKTSERTAILNELNNRIVSRLRVQGISAGEATLDSVPAPVYPLSESDLEGRVLMRIQFMPTILATPSSHCSDLVDVARGLNGVSISFVFGPDNELLFP